MAAPQKILSALHANWWLSVIGLLISFAASVVLVRTMPKELFAQYAMVLALIGVGTLIFEAGANSGLTRYLAEAGQSGARGTFYLRMQRRRWLAAAICAAALVVLGPVYAAHTEYGILNAQPWIFAAIAAIVTARLVRLLGHYGLLALFETRPALLLQQGFQIARSASLALIALGGGGLAHLVAGFFALAVCEAFLVHRRFWRIVSPERAPVTGEFVNRAQKFGLLTVVDKACAMLGSGTVLMLVLAPHQSVITMALLGLAVDLVGKLVSLTAMPMGNLVAPYLSETSDNAAAQALATSRVVKLSSLLYSFSIGFGVLVLPSFVAAVYGSDYRPAATAALLLLIPTAFENWVRGSCTPALLRNGRGRELMRVNAVQAVATIATLILVMRQSLPVAIIAVGVARALTSAFNLVLLRRIVSVQTYLVPLQGVFVSAVAVAVAFAVAKVLPVPELPRAVVASVLFTALFYAGFRWVVLRDRDTLHLAHRITGHRARLLSRLLPPTPLLPT
jgi:O-antigen/teichoic acid export membrane protein